MNRAAQTRDHPEAPPTCTTPLEWQELKLFCPFGAMTPFYFVHFRSRGRRAWEQLDLTSFLLTPDELSLAAAILTEVHLNADLPSPVTAPAGAAPPYRVAILIFDDVEVLDFAGPFEVFGVARSDAGERIFEVLTTALEPGEIVARNGLRIVPNSTASNLGHIDILVVPGGIGTRREMARPAMLDFIRTASGAADLTLSVCTGALLLGSAGLLANLSATTHWAAMDELRALNCGAEILPDARIVDNGRVITSAGVSAGIDAALYIVGRLMGQVLAEETARYMQYDWTCASVDGEKVVKASF